TARRDELKHRVRVSAWIYSSDTETRRNV
ncbi:hypothetical protein RRG08_065834, partial [Elysia crispata]